MAWESVARDLYARLAGWFPQEPRVSRFWEELSADEAQHIAFLQETRDGLSRDHLAAPLGEKELGIASQVEALLGGVRPEEFVTLYDAYELAHDLESSEINVVFRMLTVESGADLERQDLLLAQINRHLDRLTRFSREFKVLHRKLIPIRRAGAAGG
jgi:rubrerythrin